MSPLIRTFLAGSLMLSLPIASAARTEDKDKSAAKPRVTRAKVSAAQQKADQPVLAEVNLLDAAHDGRVTISAEGPGDGRMTLSVTNRTNASYASSSPPAWSPRRHRPVRRHGRHGRWYGWWYGRRYGRHGRRYGWGGMGGGMGGGWAAAWWWRHGRRQDGRRDMPATMGMMMLGRLIMYFCRRTG